MRSETNGGTENIKYWYWSTTILNRENADNYINFSWNFPKFLNWLIKFGESFLKPADFCSVLKVFQIVSYIICNPIPYLMWNFRTTPQQLLVTAARLFLFPRSCGNSLQLYMMYGSRTLLTAKWYKSWRYWKLDSFCGRIVFVVSANKSATTIYSAKGLKRLSSQILFAQYKLISRTWPYVKDLSIHQWFKSDQNNNSIIEKWVHCNVLPFSSIARQIITHMTWAGTVNSTITNIVMRKLHEIRDIVVWTEKVLYEQL